MCVCKYVCTVCMCMCVCVCVCVCKRVNTRRIGPYELTTESEMDRDGWRGEKAKGRGSLPNVSEKCY